MKKDILIRSRMVDWTEAPRLTAGFSSNSSHSTLDPANHRPQQDLSATLDMARVLELIPVEQKIKRNNTVREKTFFPPGELAEKRKHVQESQNLHFNTRLHCDKLFLRSLLSPFSCVGVELADMNRLSESSSPFCHFPLIISFRLPCTWRFYLLSIIIFFRCS